MFKNIFKGINCTITILVLLYSLCISHASYASNVDTNNAIILAYNYIDSPINAKKSISLEQFKNHIKEIKHSRYNVLPLTELLTRLKDNKLTLKEKSISIVFNNYNKVTLQKVLPILNKEDIPFTIFYSHTDIKDKAFLKEIRDNDNAELAIITDYDTPLIGLSNIEITKSINKSINYHKDLTDNRPNLFKYPKGEYSNRLLELISSYKFLGALSENLGAISSKSNFNLLSTINITKEFGDLDLFITSLNTKPLNYKDILPQDNIISTNQPTIGFTLENSQIESDKDISCFASDIGKLNTTIIDKTRVEIRLNNPLIYRTTSINCTILVLEKKLKDKSWKSFSMKLIKKGEK